jgi:hypothetical protein
VLSATAREQAKRAGERLPVPAGWRFVTSRLPLSGEGLGTIKHAVQSFRRHPTDRLLLCSAERLSDKARGRESERLPVPAGWRFGISR